MTEWFWAYYNTSDSRYRGKYSFDERIVPEGSASQQKIYDEAFIKELDNIESNSFSKSQKGNPVHYIISAKSKEASWEMTEALAQNLLRANRISSKRIEIISDIDPDAYKGTSHLEEIIENNFGGMVVIDLAEKFGHSEAEYVMTSKYIEKLFKQYRNKCLFVFTYNMDSPGFSYMILPEIKKYIVPVILKEGRGDRETSI